MPLIRLTIIFAFMCPVIFSGCRDYITGLGENDLPVLYVSNSSYSVNDTVRVFLENKSFSSIYVTGTFTAVERKELGEWNNYLIVVCSGSCPEFPVRFREIISSSMIAREQGIYRFVCSYSFTRNTPAQERILLYSGEFTVN